MSPLLAFALRGLRRSIRHFGIDIRKIEGEAGWLAPADVDPLTYQYAVQLRHVPLVAIKVASVRSAAMGFPCTWPTDHPFVLAFRAAAQQMPGRAAAEAATAVLQTYYGAVQPHSALEVLELTEEEAPGLLNTPADHWIAPWDERTVESNGRRRSASVAEEGYSHKRVITSKDGLSIFGPVTGRRLSFEVERVVKLAQSISANGFLYPRGQPLEVVGLRDCREYRWVAMRGQHRFAACVAFGIETVQTRVVKIVRRQDAEVWPHVVGGTFSVHGALKLFDRLFAGRPPRCAAQWVRQFHQEQAAVSFLPRQVGGSCHP